MSYQIEWKPQAEQDLAAIYLAASDRTLVAAATAWFDRQLAFRPLVTGRPRTSSVCRTAVFGPLSVEFDVIEDDKKVIVLAVAAVS